ncbi:hypothetical protein [Nocardioides sp. L-11A]|uniref:hypothetical protein n=1 Tax=Nocardioides sp. L-11A TaxID=3043848 RepID=UPI00249BFC4B|nr:hypothetical protein QJ852_09780 [Nocardioides sp. L-11A]
MTTMVLDQAPELTWGGFVLRGETDPDVPWQCETLATTDFGNAVPIIEFIESSLIVDGGEAVVTGWERRSFTVEIRITAPDGQAMSQAQQALFAMVHGDEKPALLWTPPMVGAWTGAFDVLAVRFLRKWDVPGDWSHRERYLRQRVFQLEFTCKTWIRDPEPIIVPALPVPEDPDDPITVDIDACNSLTGWTSPGTLHLGSGYIEVYSTGGSANNYWYTAIRTGLVTMGTTSYIRITARTAWSGVPSRPQVSFTPPGGTSPGPRLPIAEHPSSLGGLWVDYYFQPTMPAFESMRIDVGRDHEKPWEDESLLLYVAHVARTEQIEVPGSNGFQVARTITIEGSGPTGAAITLDAGTSPLLGSTALIYTGQSEAIPLRQLRATSAPVTPDPATISGSRNTLASPTTWLVPVSRLAEATYDLNARLQFTGTARVYWTARLVATDGSDVPGSDVVRSGDILLRNGSADPWKIHTLASMQMPIIKVQGLTTHKVEVTISMPVGGSAVTLDEGWLLDASNGAVTLVHEPSAHQLSGIEIQSPQLGAPRYAVVGTWVGFGSQDISRLTRLGRHRFPPGLLHIFTATDLAKYAPCSLRYHRTHAQEPGPALPEPAA